MGWPHVGGRVELHFRNNSLSDLPDCDPPDEHKDMPEEVISTGKVTAFEPPHRFGFVWYGHDESVEEQASEVIFELTEVGDGVRLTLLHKRLSNRDMMKGACGGWHTHLDILNAVLNGETVPAFWKAYKSFAEEYEKVLSGA